ncbi:MAG: hypothetical protein A3G24_19580 [Betaproteobacteria bacterium RIFCSPLOWO2_12_FULL_62_13]|nr:MAG: hypothetical protein A3G24_19580 [Betaproteobacteria bacterium RIFCSPLOWO2_12_FULL_62_13]
MSAPSSAYTAGNDLKLLCVDEFIRTLVDARALKTALELGLVDYLLEHRSGGFGARARAIEVDRTGLRFLLDLLGAYRVAEERGGKVR